MSINNYLDYLGFEVKCSPLTLRNYRHYLNRFSRFIGSSEISESKILEYKKYLNNLGLSVKTVSYHLIALRSFLKYERKMGLNIFDEDKIDVPKVQGSSIDFLTGNEVDKLLLSPDIKTVLGIRDRSIMEVLYSTGLRISELVALNKKDIDFDKKEVSIAKNDKRRLIFLSSRAIEWINKYIVARNDNHLPLFIHHSGKPSQNGLGNRLTARSIQRMFKKYQKLTGINKIITPKTLRASFAVDILMAGAEVSGVQKVLGHKNISTTQIYTHVTNKQLREVHEAFHGL